jgi:rsbT co-antagonist protein RsbR
MREQQKTKGKTRVKSGEGISQMQKVKTALITSESIYRTLVDNLPQMIFFKDVNSTYISCNKSFAKFFKTDPDKLAGTDDFTFFPKKFAEKYRTEDRRIMESGITTTLEEKYLQDGQLRTLQMVKTPVKGDNGSVLGILGIFWDITERKQAAEELRRHKEHLEELVNERTAELTRQSDIIQKQAQELLDVSTPILLIRKGIIVAPLIGMLDSQRTQRFMEQLLNAIVSNNAVTALIDITGVPAIDTQTAQHIIDTINAVRLLGSRVILTGVRPAIAQTLVHLGIDLSTITTVSSLAAGLKVALKEQGIQLLLDRNEKRR